MVGFQQALKRQSGADVIINFKQGTAETAWKSGAKFDYEAVKKAVSKSAELTLRSITLTVRGEVIQHAGKPALKATGTAEIFVLAGRLEGLSPAPADGNPRVVSVTGLLQEPKRGADGPLTLTVEKVQTPTAAR